VKPERLVARLRAFYGKAFGWTFTNYGPAYCEFSDGRMTGGFAIGSPVTPGGPLVILYADHTYLSLALITDSRGPGSARSAASERRNSKRLIK
jgi:predicted enzyme related to lactoylglutathione lyase